MSDTNRPHLDASVHEHYELREKLGRGCFANVYRVIRRRDGEEFAMKVIRTHKVDQETRTILRNEHTALRLVSQYPGVATLHETIETPTELCFILEYVRGGPLLDEIATRGNFSENDARLFLRPALRTLAFMAKVGVVHRDIKPENLLCDGGDANWPLKLTDFGLSAKLQKDCLLYNSCGTPIFAAPEVLSNGDGYDCAADAWSFGVLLYVVLCGYAPFSQRDAGELVDAIRSGSFDFPETEWRWISEEAKNVVRGFLTVDPKLRLTPAQALQHSWFDAQQSCSALPNHRLDKFNAAAKIRALLITIRTACGWRRLISTSSKSIDDTGERASALFAQVQHARSVIAQIESRIADQAAAATPASAVRRDGTQNPPRLPLQTKAGLATLRRRRSVRSLVLPTVDVHNEAPDLSPRCISSVQDEVELQNDLCVDGEVTEIQRTRAVVRELRKSQQIMFASLNGDRDGSQAKYLTKPHLALLDFNSFDCS